MIYCHICSVPILDNEEGIETRNKHGYPQFHCLACDLDHQYGEYEDPTEINEDFVIDWDEDR